VVGREGEHEEDSCHGQGRLSSDEDDSSSEDGKPGKTRKLQKERMKVEEEDG